MSTDARAALDPAPGHAIIVFDGVCHLCNGWVQFLLRRDRAARYRFASMQSARGRALLSNHGLDPDDPVSLLLLRDGVAQTDSDAILEVLAGLGGAWRAARWLRLVPRVLRDPPYRWLARRRYRLFGRRETCWMPSPETAARFLD
jgi:predicted DCC family thiol-disulfide oxidoreductase YuxK